MLKRQRGKRESQHDKFVGLAKESGASGSEGAFVSKLKRLAGKKTAKPKSAGK